MSETDRQSSVRPRSACLWQSTSQEVMDGFSTGCETGPAMILVSLRSVLLLLLLLLQRLANLFFISHPFSVFTSDAYPPPLFDSLSVLSCLPTQIYPCAFSAVYRHASARARVFFLHRLFPTWAANGFHTFQNWLLSMAEWKIMWLGPKIASGARLLRCVLSLQLHLHPPLWTIFPLPEL